MAQCERLQNVRKATPDRHRKRTIVQFRLFPVVGRSPDALRGRASARCYTYVVLGRAAPVRMGGQKGDQCLNLRRTRQLPITAQAILSISSRRISESSASGRTTRHLLGCRQRLEFRAPSSPRRSQDVNFLPHAQSAALSVRVAATYTAGLIAGTLLHVGEQSVQRMRHPRIRSMAKPFPAASRCCWPRVRSSSASWLPLLQPP